MEFKIGDIVSTVKGDCNKNKLSRTTERLKIIKLDVKWGKFDGAVCESLEDGRKTMFLIKNLILSQDKN